MGKTTSATPTHITLLVPDETIHYARGLDAESVLGIVESREPDTEARQDKGFFGATRRWFVNDKQLPLHKLKEQLSRVEQEVDGLLASVESTTQTGYQLTSFQVGVGISGQGSLGIVSAGVHASLTLIYARPSANL